MEKQIYRDGISAVPIRIFKDEKGNDFLHEIKDPEAFRKLLSIAQKESKELGASVTLKSIDAYASMKHLFLSPDGLSGIGVDKDSNACSLFSSPSAPKGRGVALVSFAIKNGGHFFDCYDTFLGDYYAKHGGRVVARCPWSIMEKHDPPVNWNKEAMKRFNNGEPDTLFGVADPKRVLGYFENYSIDLKSGVQAVTSPNAAKELQRLEFSKIQQREETISKLLNENGINDPNWSVGPTPDEEFSAKALGIIDDALLVAPVDRQGKTIAGSIQMLSRERMRNRVFQKGEFIKIPANVTENEHKKIVSKLEANPYRIAKAPSENFSAQALVPSDDGKSFFVRSNIKRGREAIIHKIGVQRIKEYRNIRPGNTLEIEGLLQRKPKIMSRL